MFSTVPRSMSHLITVVGDEPGAVLEEGGEVCSMDGHIK